MYCSLSILFFAGPGKEIYTKGAGGAKGHDGGEEKLYCQVRTWDYSLVLCIVNNGLFCWPAIVEFSLSMKLLGLLYMHIQV